MHPVASIPAEFHAQLARPLHPALLAASGGEIALAVLGAVIGVLVIAGLWLMATYNGLVSRRLRVQNGFAQIDVQLRRRHDLVPNLVAAVKGYMAHERDTLEAVVQARAAAMGAQQAVAANPGNAAATIALGRAEGVFQRVLGRMSLLMERYPDLKANQNALQLQEELVTTENRIAFARQAYNDAVMTYNTKLAVFPDVLVARLFAFPAATLFETDDASRAVPQVDFARAAAPSAPSAPSAAGTPGAPS
jgi:LemA protein